jgi:excisionase family DNA binding protein
MTLLSPSPFITDGQDISLLPMPSELTVAQAAKILGIPKSDLIELLDAGEIESYTFGNQRTVIAASFHDYNRETARLQDEALDELVQQAQELGVY